MRESKCNGAVERAVRTWQAQFRTLRPQFESRIGTKLRKGSSMMSWLISFTSEVLSNFKVHANGSTTYEMTTGHRCEHSVHCFGAKVHFKMNIRKDMPEQSGVIAGHRLFPAVECSYHGVLGLGMRQVSCHA